MNQKQLQRLYKQLGENIKKQRKLKGLTQEQLANSLELTRTSVVNIEQGRQHPPLHLLFTLADALQISMDKLLPSQNDFTSGTSIDAQTLKDVSEKDVSKITSFLNEFMKTSQGHE